jgi:F-type H+-transporting ATPase subunit epsilon
MTLNLRVMAPNRIVLTSEVEEIILSSNTGQIGILPNHAPLLTALDIGIMKLRIANQWSAVALMGGFAQINQNQITILVNEAEKATDIDPKAAEEAFNDAQTIISKAIGKKQIIEANLAYKRAKARLEATQI